MTRKREREREREREETKDPTSWLNDRGVAKVCNCDPAALADAGGTWARMATKNHAIFGDRMAAGMLTRNSNLPGSVLRRTTGGRGKNRVSEAVLVPAWKSLGSPFRIVDPRSTAHNPRFLVLEAPSPPPPPPGPRPQHMEPPPPPPPPPPPREPGEEAAPSSGFAPRSGEEAAPSPGFAPRPGEEAAPSPGGAMREEARAILRRTPRVKIIFFGLSNCSVRQGVTPHAHALQQWWASSGTRGRVPQELLENMLRESGKAEPTDVTVFFDCRIFHDPNGGALRGHVGVHPDIASGLLQAHLFRPFWGDVKRTLQPALRAGPHDVAIGFYCRSGKHRSVALAHLAHGVLSRTHRASPPDGLQQENAWRRTCRGCCSECAGPQRETRWAAVLATAQQFWDEVPACQRT